MYKGELLRVRFKLLPTNMTAQHYTQLANYDLPKFEAGISKKAKRGQSAALLLIENALYS